MNKYKQTDYKAAKWRQYIAEKNLFNNESVPKSVIFYLKNPRFHSPGGGGRFICLS